MRGWGVVGRSPRIVLVMAGTLVLGAALRAAGAGLILPLLLPLPTLALGWYSMQSAKAQRCPTCDLPLSYRRLGPSHGLLECPALCGYRRLVGDPRARP